MRTLLLMRGAPACGKSTWIKENGWTEYALEPDQIRLQHQPPVLFPDGRLGISQRNDKNVWQYLINQLETRMQNGCFTIIDATNIGSSTMNKYKKLAEQYRYELYYVDMTNVPLETLKERNRARAEIKQVPDEILERMYTEGKDKKFPRIFKKLPQDASSDLLYQPKDFSAYRKIVHIGDIHGCASALKNYFGDKELDDDTLYIFLGDFIDRGIENAEVLHFILSIASRENVILLEGNHEHWLNDFANEIPAKSNEFEYQTRPQLVAGGITPQQMRGFYHSLKDCIYYRYHDKFVLANHAGISRIPDNLLYVSSSSMIKGVGGYGDLETVENAWDTLMPEDHYQIHGHRNIRNNPIQSSKRCFNLEGKVEFGGSLRILELSTEGFNSLEIPNPVPPRIKNKILNKIFRPMNTSAPREIRDEATRELLTRLRQSSDIRERNFGTISSFNFTHSVFSKARWNSVTCKARGLFINIDTCQIVARSYDKFFNINERPETTFAALKHKFEFPVTAFVKENGYLGIVGYDQQADELVISSKADMLGEYAQIFRHILQSVLDLEAVKNYLKDHNTSLIFEVIDPDRDPHIIQYEKPHVVLLDEVKNQVIYEKTSYEKLTDLAAQFHIPCKKQALILNNWEEFCAWHNEVNNPEYQYKNEYIEGFVLEASNGFMTKLKLDFYKGWKKLRTLAHIILKQRDINQDNANLSPQAKDFTEWLQNKMGSYPNSTFNKNYPFATDIISLRKMYLSEKSN